MWGGKVSGLKYSLLLSASAVAIYLGQAAASQQAHAQSICTNFTPISGETVTCTFDTDTDGNAIPIETPIIAPGSTGVTVNITDPVARGFDNFEGVLAGGTPTINLGGGATINISNADVSNVSIAEDDFTTAFDLIAPDLMITSAQDFVDFLISQGIDASLDADGDVIVPDDQANAATLALANNLAASSGAVIELNAGAPNTINLDQADPALADGDINGALAGGVRLAPNTIATVELGSGGIFSIGTGGFGIQANAGADLTLNGAGGDLTVLGAETPVIELLGDGTMATITLDDTTVSTAGENAPAFVSRGDNNTLTATISETIPGAGAPDLAGPIAGETLVSTIGDNSPIFQSTGDNSTLTVTINNAGATESGGSDGVQTFGDNSPIVDVSGAGSEGTLSASNSVIQTFGDNSPIIRLQNTSDGTVSFTDSLGLSTSGENSPAVSIESTGIASLSGSFFDILTSGGNSPGVMFDVTGSGADAVVVLGSGEVATSGDQSGAIILELGQFTSGEFAVSTTGLDSLTTEGANSPAFSIVVGDENSVFINSFATEVISTIGDNSPGTFVSVGSGAAEQTITFGGGTPMTTTTVGNNSAGIHFDLGDSPLLDFNYNFPSGSSVQTQGDNSPAFKLEAGTGEEFTITISPSTFTTTGTNSPAFVFDPLMNGAPAGGSEIGFNVNDSTLSTTGDISDALVLSSGPGGANTMLPAAAAGPNAITTSTVSTTGAFSNAFVIGEDVIVHDGDAPGPALGASDLVADLDQFTATGTGSRAILNNGTLNGGAMGLTFGDGVVGNIADNGLIQGTGATAVTFNWTDDTFELQPGSTTTGIVDAGGGTDTFVLGGEGTASFDRNLIGTQFLNFETFIKEDLSTFTLTSPNDLAWTITGGELILGDDTTPFGATPFTLTTGQTRTANAMTGLDEIIDTFGTLTVSAGNTVTTNTADTNAVNIIGQGTVNVNGGTITTVMDGSAGVAGVGPGANNIEVNVTSNGAVATIMSTGNDSPLVQNLSDNSSTVVNLTGTETTPAIATTTGDNSPVVEVSGAGSEGSLVAIDSTAQTSGMNSEIFRGVGGGDATIALQNSTVETTGNGSGAFIVPAGSEIATFIFFSSTASTQGEMAPVISTETNQDVTIFGTMTSFSTQGNFSAGISNITADGGELLTTLPVISINTMGDNSAAILTNLGDDVLHEIVVSDTTLSTVGSNAPTHMIQAGSVEAINSIFSTSNITTMGSNSPGFVIEATSANSVNSLLSDINITTSGANSPAFVFNPLMNGMAAPGSTVDFTATGTLFRTTGDGSNGFEIGANFDDPNVTAMLDFSGLTVETEGAGSNGLVIGSNSTIPFAGSISTIGDGSQGIFLNFDAGVDLSGTVVTAGANANGILGVAGPGGPTEITLSTGSSVTATGEGASAVYLAGFGTANILVEEGATATAATDATIGEGGTGAIDTTLIVAGTVTRTEPGELAIDLALGNDTLIVLPTFEINGGVDLGEGMDTLAFDAAAGETGTVNLFQNATPFAVDVERIEKRGAGTWIFEGDDVPLAEDLAPAFIVDGTAIVNINAPGLDLTNEAGGTLMGTGTVGNLVNNGTFAPGASIGTFNVAGDLTLNAGGTLEIEIEAPDMADLINVGGTTNLGGALDVQGQGMLTAFMDGNMFTIIDSAGDVSGGFDMVTEDIPDLDLEVNVVDGGDGGEEVVLTLVGTATPDVTDKAVHPNSTQASATLGRNFTETLQRRSRSGNVPGGQVASLAIEPTAVVIPAADLEAPVSENRTLPGYSTWIAGIGGFSDVDGSPGITGFDATTGGILIGFDRTLVDGDRLMQIGIAGGYSNTDLDSGPSEADVDTGHIGAYAKLETGPWLVSAAFGYGFQDYDFDRFIPLGGGAAVTANGDADGDVLSLSAAVSHDIAPMLGIDHGGALRFGALVRVDFIDVNRDSFTETGAGILNLTVAQDDFSRGWFSTGVEMAGEIVTAQGLKFLPHLELRYERALDDPTNTANSAIVAVAGASFTALSASPDRDLFSLATGFDLELTDKVSANIRYDGTYSGDFESHRASGGFTYRF